MNPLVSVIVPTKDSTRFLRECLESVKSQTYERVELIVVDNFSSDGTLEVARHFADRVLVKGPERSPQRNFGAAQAQGEYVLFVDSDMQLSPGVVSSCVAQAESLRAITVPEESVGTGFWARCKRLERSFYAGVSWIEAPRFFNREFFLSIGGYNETLIGGEDWDLATRVSALTPVGRVGDVIYHNEGNLSLWTLVRKKFYYGQTFRAYAQQHRDAARLRKQVNPLTRFLLFFTNPSALLRDPLVGGGVLVMKAAEFAAAGLGLAQSQIGARGRRR